MALRGDMNVIDVDISYFMDATATRGGIACISTAGSGTALDQSVAVASMNATASGALPLGVLMQEVVNKDLTQTYLNQYKHEVQVGDKVTLLTRGWVVTNQVFGTPTAGNPAYVGPSGLIAATQANPVVPSIGQWLSTKDEDGYAKVSINLPNAV